MWGQKHWTDSTMKWTGKPYEGANMKMVFERPNSRAEESGWTENTKIKNKAQMFAQMLTCIQASISDEYATRTY